MNTPPDDRDYWFTAKTYGWGWGLPCRWQGWVFLLGWLASLYAVVGGLIHVAPRLTMLAVIVWVVILLVVCYRKGPPPRWRWGHDDDPSRRRDEN